MTREAAIVPGFYQDLYAALGEQLDNGAWAVRIYYKPFVRWIWFGGVFMAIGGVLAMLDKRYQFGRRDGRPRHEQEDLALSAALHHLPAGACSCSRGSTPTHQAPESVMVDKEVPVFTLQDIYDLGKQHDRSILKGRPMLLNVWATWCPTCYQEHTYLKELAGQGIYIVGMNYKDEQDKAIKWLAELGNPYQINLSTIRTACWGWISVFMVRPRPSSSTAKASSRYRHVGT